MTDVPAGQPIDLRCKACGSLRTAIGPNALTGPDKVVIVCQSCVNRAMVPDSMYRDTTDPRFMNSPRSWRWDFGLNV